MTKFRRSERSLPARRGMIAISELLVMVTILVGLFWFGAQFMAVISSVPGAAAATHRAVSDRSVYRISLNEAGDRIWIYRPRSGVTEFDMKSREPERIMSVHGNECTTVAHSADGQSTVICNHDGSIVLYRENFEPMTQTMVRSSDMVIDAAISHNGDVVACVTQQGKVFGWSRQGQQLKEFHYSVGGDAPILRGGLNRDGKRVFVARVTGKVSFHSPDTGEEVAEPVVVDRSWLKDGECTAIAWSFDERLLAFASSAGLIRVQDLQSNRIICEGKVDHPFSGTRPVSIAISKDCRRLAATTNTSKEIYLWDLETAMPAGRLAGHDGIVRSLEFGRQSSILYSGSYDGTVREWLVEKQALNRIID